MHQPEGHAGSRLPADEPASAAAVDQLLALLGDFAGFRPSDGLRRKLERLFGGIAPAETQAWLARARSERGRDELVALVEGLTNHETYFFRDRVQLDALERELLPRLLRERAAGGARSLRLWSAGCATGEEAFTLAFLVVRAMLDARLAVEFSPGDVRLAPDWRVEILGSDISRQALRVAQAGAYQRQGLGSFRQFPPEYERFFEPAGAAPAAGAGTPYLRVKDCIRKLVRFEHFNLVETPPPLRHCDVVLCRNLLIYIGHGKQVDIQRTLAEALRPGGFLMLSPVDTLHAGARFAERRLEKCILYERT